MAVAPPSLDMSREPDPPIEGSARRGSRSDTGRRSSESRNPVGKLIRKAEEKRVAKRKIIDFLKRKGISEDQIIEAYKAFYEHEGLYEITFNKRPLGFSVISDTRAKNAIVSTIHSSDNRKLGMELASRVYEINGKRVDGLKHSEILDICGPSAPMPLVVVFKRPPRKSKWIRDDEEYSSGDESYDSDEDEKHVKKYRRQKRESLLRKEQNSLVNDGSGSSSQATGSSELPVPREKRNSTSASHSQTFRMVEIAQWDEGELEETRQDMVKELARLMLENGATGTTMDLEDSELQSQLSSRSAQTLQAISRGVTPSGARSDGTPFQFEEELSALNSEIDIPEGEVDPEIYQYLQELIGSNTYDPSTPSHPETPLSTRAAFSELTGDEELDVMETMRSGSTLMKYGRYGKPKFRRFQLTSDNQYLIWFSEKKSLEQTKIPIALIEQIRIGRDSDVTRRTNNEEIHETSFTVVYRREPTDETTRQLTVSATNTSEAYIWAQGLKILADAAARGHTLDELRIRAPSGDAAGVPPQQTDEPPESDDMKDTDFVPARHERHGSVVIAMDEMRRNSIMKRFNVGRRDDEMSSAAIEKNLARCHTNINRIVKFFTMGDGENFKVIEASGQYEGIKMSLQDLDMRLARARQMHESGDPSKKSAIKADIFTLNAELDALKQKLTAISRTPHRL